MTTSYYRKELPSIDRLRDVFNYDAETGIFTWKIDRSVNAKVGEVAGTKRKDGYIFLTVDCKQIGAHRVAWAMTNGQWSDAFIDHKNTVKSDNRASNLRQATRSQNAHNAFAQESNTSGLKGITSHRGKWVAQIKIANKQTYIGIFSAKEDAHAAYAAKAKEVFGEFGRAS